MRGRESGFTLIEMLIAMAIFSALIAVLMLGYQQGLMLWQKSQQQSRVWLDYEFRYRLLDNMMTQAVVATDVYAKGVISAYFKGSKYSFRMLTRAPLMDASTYVREVNVAFKQGVDGYWQLFYRESPRYSEPARGSHREGSWTLLLAGLSKVGFQFEAEINPMPADLQGLRLAASEQAVYRNAAEWLSDFDAYKLSIYPQRIRMYFTDTQGEPHEWLFVMPVRSDAWTMYAYSDEL